MSFKWNDYSTLVFLNAYRKHQCLWNLHYVKYYDCLAKNDALKNIIKELNIPKLNISDCLEQIKVIRKKYGREQTRVIKGFQSGKPYKSPYAWFPVIAEMLTQVIDDEGKLQNGMEVETISPVKDCITTPYDKYKNIFNFPCMQERQDHKTKPRKNTKFTKTGNFDILGRKSEGQNDAQLLQCPSCGWEDIKPDRLDIPAKKAYKKIKSLDTTVPCPEYSNLANKPYERYKAHRIGDTIYQGKYNNIIPCPSFPSRLSRPKFCTRETQLSSEQLFPERRAKEAGTRDGQRDKRIQNTVCVSKTVRRKCCRKIQTKPLTSQDELKQAAVNTIKQLCDKEIQNTICTSLTNDCQASQKYSSTQELKQNDANIVECPANDAMRNTIGIKLKVEGSMPNSILITTDGNDLPLIQRDLKELTTNKCQKDIDNYDVKAEKTRLALDDKKLVENEVCFKETCSHDVIEIIKHNSAVMQALLQCLEKVVQERTKICSVTSLLSKRHNVNSNSSEMTVCEQIPYKFTKENTHLDTSSSVDLESLNCSSCLEKTEKDDIITMVTKTFLDLMKHALVQNDKNVRKGCVRKEDAINTFIVLSKIKECADEILKIYTLVDCSKRQLLNKFYRTLKSKSKCACSSKQDSALNSIQAQGAKEDAVDQFAASYADSKDIEVLYGPSTSKTRDHSLSENGTTYAETVMEDKDVTARTENHDVGLNAASLSRIQPLRDSETQYTPSQLQDAGIVTDRSFEERISVATQNREPISIRVIKSNNSEGILKLDKETCVRDAHVLWNADKWSRNTYQKYSVREYYDELSHPGISHVREKEVNSIDYRTFLLSNGNHRYNKGYRRSLPCNRNWARGNIPNLGLSLSQRVSRIPSYTKSRKYVRRRTDLYRMSQSYV
ncbi:PREDICTED: uncharacterized protein LOC105460905 isoform X2 [Wasmannia auropunctata]|uniref:uncharacterized protein LOC105460905 isoform X2 n=1 Tax=Wasmannia auropunctata TaxID=64793 RepID=UPI0005EFB66F|nr:PREDICTED: uncharacterized protein LOC105460905 isoform X2 [Wasmannia auropunctata]